MKGKMSASLAWTRRFRFQIAYRFRVCSPRRAKPWAAGILVTWAALWATSALADLPRRSLWFLVLSGVATGVSWLAYFRALQLAPASRVAPIDKLSLPLTVVLAALLLGETVGWRLGIGVALMTAGALLTIGA